MVTCETSPTMQADALSGGETNAENLVRNTGQDEAGEAHAY